MMETIILKLKEELEKELNQQAKIAIFGQPGAGKSSLINSIIGKDVAAVGTETDKTITAQDYEYGGVYITDLPGYGTEKFPIEGYLKRFDISSYDAFVCVFNNKFHEADAKFFRELQKTDKSCIFVRSGLDAIFEKNRTISELKAAICDDTYKYIGQKVELYFVSNRTNEGLAEFELALKQSIPQAKKDCFARGAKARSSSMLDAKYKASESLVTKYSLLAAANGINPIPIADISLDMKIMFDLFKKLRAIYGITDNDLDNKGSFIPIAQKLLNMATKEGLIVIAKQSAGRKAVQQFSKYIPVVGQVLAASISYAITSHIGKAYLDDCHKFATALLHKEIDEM